MCDFVASAMNRRVMLAGLVYAFIATVDVARCKDPEPQYCQDPRPTTVAVDAPYFNYWPFYVELHRCGGSCSTTSPRIQRCVIGSSDDITYMAYNLATGETKEIKLTNHTACNCSCVQTPDSCMDEVEKWDPSSCSCTCVQPTSSPYPCAEGFKWSQHVCRCLCNRAPEDCPQNKEWSNDACRCVCKMDTARQCNDMRMLLDPEACTCYKNPPVFAAREATGVPRDVVVGSMLAEFIVLVLLFDLFLFYKYRYGVMALVYHKCCAANSNQDQQLEAASEANGEKAEEQKKSEETC